MAAAVAATLPVMWPHCAQHALGHVWGRWPWHCAMLAIFCVSTYRVPVCGHSRRCPDAGYSCHIPGTLPASALSCMFSRVRPGTCGVYMMFEGSPLGRAWQNAPPLGNSWEDVGRRRGRCPICMGIVMNCVEDAVNKKRRKKL